MYVSISVPALLNNLAEVPASTVLHDDVQSRVALVEYFIIVPHNVLMAELAQNVHLIDQLLLLLILHLAIVDLLPYHQPPRFQVLN